MKKLSIFNLVCWLSGIFILTFIILPLASTIASTSPVDLALTIQDEELKRSISITFIAATAATLMILLTGLPLAYLLARYRFPGKRIIESIIDLPIVIPHTAAGIALLMVYGREQIIGKLFSSSGLIFTDHLMGTILAMTFVSLPFLINPARTAFELVEPELEKTALLEGATHWQAFIHITLPIAWRGILSGMLMMWARGISEFGAVAILAYHPKTIPTLIYERFQGFGLSAAQPAAVILILAAFLVFAVVRGLLLKDETDQKLL